MRTILIASMLAITAFAIPVASADCSQTDGTFIVGTATLHQTSISCSSEYNDGTYSYGYDQKDTNTKVSESTTGVSVTLDQYQGDGHSGPVNAQDIYHYHGNSVNVDTPAGGVYTGAGYGDELNPTTGCQQYVYGGAGQVYTKSATCSGLLA